MDSSIMTLAPSSTVVDMAAFLDTTNLLLEPPTTTTSSQPATIKMEDLETKPSMLMEEGIAIIDHFNNSTSAPAGSSSSFSTTNMRDVSVESTASTPAASSGDSKQPKKRKSWGQVLPEPKTSLPPRKRAKTADEKEQRRIERVKRNRLAAHNSRERKRQEVEDLQGNLDEMLERLKKMEQLARQQASELDYYRSMFPDAVAGGNLASLKHTLDNTLQNPLQSLATINLTHKQESSSSIAPTSTNPSPNLVPSILTTPDSLLQTLDSPATSPEPATPRFESNSLFTLEPSEVDQTQHSAAMLCPGLQCRSTSLTVPCSLSKCVPSKPTTVNHNHTSAPLMQRHRRYHPMTIYSTILMVCSLLISSLQTLTSLSTVLQSRPTIFSHLLQPSTLLSLASSPTTSPLLRSLLRFLPLISTTITSTTTMSPTTVTMMAVWITHLMASSPICTPAQAQQSLLATSQALLRSKRHHVQSKSSIRVVDGSQSCVDTLCSDDPGVRKARSRPGGTGCHESRTDIRWGLGGGWEARFREIVAHKRRSRGA